MITKYISISESESLKDSDKILITFKAEAILSFYRKEKNFSFREWEFPSNKQKNIF